MNAENLRKPALIVIILAWAALGLTLTSAFAQAAWLIAYTQFAETPLLLAIAEIVGSLSNVVYFASIFAVLVWVYTAHNNLHRAGLSGLNYSPAWATFSFFVPVFNLFVPFKAMRELANRSAGEPVELAEADVDEVMSWWACWIGSLVVSLFVLYTAIVTLMPGIWVTTPFWATQGLIILANILTAAAAYFLIKVVQLVTRSQQEGVSDVSTFE